MPDFKFIRKTVLFIFIVVLVSCENDIEVIRNLDNTLEIPTVEMKEIEILYSDSARLKMKITAPEVKRFTQPDKQYTEFPKGINVYQFDTALNVIAEIHANHAIFYEKTKLWVARNNVTGKNTIKNEQLSTEELFWDQAAGKIYSNKSTTITNSDGVFYGEKGFEAKEDMSHWKMIGISGKVNLKENNDTIKNP